jgi:hypothetical protein
MLFVEINEETVLNNYKYFINYSSSGKSNNEFTNNKMKHELNDYKQENYQLK